MMCNKTNAMPGVIAIDLDGTAFDADHKSMMPRTFRALSHCLAAGICVVPTTGRCEYVIPMEALPPVRYVISCNGGLITDRSSGEILLAKYIAKADVIAAWERIRDRVRQHDLVVEMFEDRQIVVERRIMDDPQRYECRLPKFHRALVLGGSAKYIDSFDQYVKEEGERVVKINFPGNNIERCPELREELRAMGLFEVTSDGMNLEVTAKNCCKGESLLWLSNYLGVAPGNTVAFGDSDNDLSMLRVAGYGVAMGNASQSIKAETQYRTSSNTEEGIAEFLEKHFGIVP